MPIYTNAPSLVLKILEEVADVVEEGPEEHEGSEAQGRSVDDDFIDADEVLGRLESALGDDRASDGHVREPIA